MGSAQTIRNPHVISCRNALCNDSESEQQDQRKIEHTTKMTLHPWTLQASYTVIREQYRRQRCRKNAGQREDAGLEVAFLPPEGRLAAIIRCCCVLGCCYVKLLAASCLISNMIRVGIHAICNLYTETAKKVCKFC